ncbi:hypothetical protein SAMN04488042_104227 [Shimia aestuarii]|uniref:Tetratricopeptide repeat-containing protein n=2 Tax=Shimia aestuarii TaxID=254406 RepID=A0A1I4NJN0_9RHOB|nr:hypothetical protein [Shimia aestuarii]SFM15666.1 hypothetical protein SAMN04488042_104227 [Shimia aestuarii]
MNTYDYDLGQHSFAVTTTSPDAQRWFDRGLNWTYNYNHEEAVVCFQKAAEADPNCAMAHWGIAYAAGPNYNMWWEHFDDAGRAEALATSFAATQAAMDRLPNTTEVEAALIRALPARYPQEAVTDIDTMETWNDAFANAMRTAHAAHPDSLEVTTIFAESLLNRFPWNMWNLPAAAPTEGADTLECEAILERAMANDPAAMRHPGLLHLYVHLMEMSPYPEKALKAGDVLRTLMPDGGHLIHMPTHIDVLCGHYENVVRWNQAATVADMKFYEREGPYNIYTGYRIHNYHFVIYGALFLGQMQPALDANQGILDTCPEEMLRVPSPPMADYFESYCAMYPHILIRFGKWQELTQLDPPEDPDLYCTLNAYTYYARGVANAALGNVAQAEIEAAAFAKARAAVPETRLLHTNTVVDLLEVAHHMLHGELEYRKENYDLAFDHLRKAVHFEDNLNYDEPWGWMQPVRHALGALLFEQGHLAEAEAVYREDLGLGGQLSRATMHPDNIWALRGLHDCLKARGDTAELLHIRQRLDLAEARADASVKASCACAQAAMAAS